MLLLCCQPEQAVEQAINLPVIWDAMMLMWHHCNAEPFTLGQGCNLCPLLYFPWVYIPVRNIQELMHLKMNEFWIKIYHDDILIHFWKWNCHNNSSYIKTAIVLDLFIAGTNYNYTLRNEVVGGYIGFTPSVRTSVCFQLMTSCCMNFVIIIQWINFTIWKKENKNCHHYNTKSSLYNIISRHYKKSLLRSQIYHGYEELPYMKKTRKKKQVCGAACFMAAEIKFSKVVRPSVCPA